ncbi:amidohydrolase family protein [Rhodothermus bifroesti]|uniref:amidohydrolase family protein n=1 Tax=Rhodothermus bifroesti TaxID=2823335 RepID=UPI001AEF7761|nr:amidohydrolase family protein [Rhodothermus bifroesti]
MLLQRIGFILLVALPSASQAQNRAAESAPSPPVVTRTYAITQARIVVAPGRIIPQGTVVLRNGLIEAVGPNVSVPPDAFVIQGDSLVVYAGFIDGLSHVGIPAPKQEETPPQRSANPGNPPPERAGLTPERDVRVLLKPDDPSVEQLRRAGFTLAHVVPREGMLPGRGALVLLRGSSADAMIYRSDASLFVQLEPARGVYPATDMAVLARFRQLYREAARRHHLNALYAANPSGLEPPPYDAVHAAFFPVLEGKKPVFFYTEDALDLHRVLALHRELNFPVVLAGLAGSFDILEKLRASNIPLFLTLNLPEAPRDTAAKAIAPSDDSLAAQYRPNLRVVDYRNTEAERQNLKARQALERIKYYETASRLHAAGLRFGFSTRDVEPKKIAAHLRTMGKHGLSEEAALAALTIDAARLLGIDQAVGTVEPGKLANLVITDGPLFNEKTRIRYVFVAGELFEIKAPEEARRPPTETPLPTADGTWSCTVSSPDGPVDGTLRIRQGSGTISSSALPQPATLENFRLQGQQLTFGFFTSAFGQVTARLTLTGQTAEGSLDVPGYGTLPLRCHRTESPQR